MIPWLRNLIGLLVSLLIVYGMLYFGYRYPHTQTWGDEQVVVFGSELAYECFRPAMAVDAALTGMRFHLGPHREPH